MGYLTGQNIAGFAYSEIKHLIMQKEFKPGQRLAEITLSNKIGVSRTPIREALRMLANEGWVSIIQNSGAWVAAPTRNEIIDAYEFRNKLEEWGIKKAMPNVTPLLIRKLEDNIEDETDAYRGRRYEKYFDVNNRFHMLIAEAGGNTELCGHLKIALSKSVIYMSLYENYDFDHNDSFSEHKGILECIKKHNEEDVVMKMQTHIEHGFNRLHLT